MATIVYDNRYEFVEYLAGGGIGLHEQGAMSEIVLVKDRSDSESALLVLKRPMVSQGNLISQRQLQIQNDAIIKEMKTLEFVWNLRERVACQTNDVIKAGVDDKNFLPLIYNYFITTRASGKPLSEFTSPPPLVAIFNIYAKVIECLYLLHNNNIVYNDTRHEHFFWDEVADPIAKNKKSVTIIDFGNAYFLPGSKLESFNFKEALERKTANDDFVQLAHSLYRLLTGNELKSTSFHSGFSFKTEYLVVGETVTLDQLTIQTGSIISKLMSGDAQNAHDVLLKWAGFFEQNREVELSRVNESLGLYSSFDELNTALESKYLVIGKPDRQLSDKWKKYYDNKSYNKILEKTKNEVNDLIVQQEWRKLLAGPLSQLFRYDPSLRSFLEPIIENLKGQKANSDLAGIITRIISHDMDGATKRLVTIFEQDPLPSESELRGSLLPFAEKFYASQKKFQPSSMYHDFYFENLKVDTPQQLLSNYERLLEGKFGVINAEYRGSINEIIELLNRTLKSWSDFYLDQVVINLDKLLSLDILNSAIKSWHKTCSDYAEWLSRIVDWPGYIPAPQKFNHILLDKLKNLTLSLDESQSIQDTLREAERIFSASLPPKLQMRFKDWISTKRKDLMVLFENEAKSAFIKPNRAFFQKIISNTEQRNYLEENLLEWYRLCWCLYQLAEKQNELNLNELSELVNTYATEGIQHPKWNLLKKGINYFQQRMKVHEVNSFSIETAAKEFERAAIEITSRENLHWLYRLFVLGDQIGTADNFFRTPSYPKPNIKIDVEVTKTQSSSVLQKIFGWKGIPTTPSIFMGMIASGVLVLISIIAFQILNLIETNRINAPSQTPTALNLTPCEQANAHILKSEYSLSQELLYQCTDREDRQKVIHSLIMRLEYDIKNMNYDPSMIKNVQNVSAWPDYNSAEKQAIQNLGLCAEYLNLKILGENEKMHNAFSEMTDWIDLGAPIQQGNYDQWQLSCGWNPASLLIDAAHPPVPNSEKLTATPIENDFILLPNYLSFPTLSYVPKTARHYEITSPAIAGARTEIFFKDNYIPNAYLSVNFEMLPPLLNDRKERMIIGYWNYTPTGLELGYKIYAPIGAISVELIPGSSIEDFAAKYNITVARLKELNPEKTLDSDIPVQLIVIPNIDVSVSPIRFASDTQEWYLVQTNQKIFIFERTEISLSYLLPELVIAGEKPEGFPDSFLLNVLAQN